jgi:hypothetical protein
MQPALTHKQRTALKAIEGVTFSRNSIEIFVPDEHDEGYADRDKTDAAMKEVEASGIEWGGSRAGHGGWCLRRDHVDHPADAFDFNNPASRHHY